MIIYILKRTARISDGDEKAFRALFAGIMNSYTIIFLDLLNQNKLPKN